ncbi:hypothetical protein P8H26_00190 [Pseudochrobactrum sp. sp1633]|uniref:hypothetical protein n=1 Tax=Pseudochrobactrum sp. sp1633 TaxID=3036706 RepID=UPI0025A5F965|nr:hypothetical protein [Pseudochrobactrum sp. sp1633]MDM8343813.1 hypothetical protein [Pseudochrobactrum sp. sp1633]HWD11795.1 hypothetical protein [Pseudochrobactrum sp.]
MSKILLSNAYFAQYNFFNRSRKSSFAEGFTKYRDDASIRIFQTGLVQGGFGAAAQWFSRPEKFPARIFETPDCVVSSFPSETEKEA